MACGADRAAPGARGQRGYALEVPLAMAAAGIAVALALPELPGWAGKLLLGAGALVWVGGLYYMLLAPGWRPGAGPGPGRWTRLLAFAASAVLIVLGVATYILAG